MAIDQDFQQLLANLGVTPWDDPISGVTFAAADLPSHRTSLSSWILLAACPEPAGSISAWLAGLRHGDANGGESRASSIERAARGLAQLRDGDVQVGEGPPTVFVACAHPVTLEQRRRWAEKNAFIAFSLRDALAVDEAGLPRWLFNVAVEATPLSAAVPYQTEGPVVGNRFFGRDTLLNAIGSLTQQNYVITGIRGIGKSSLLRAIVRRLYARGHPRIAVVSGEGTPVQSDLLRQIALVTDKSAVRGLVQGSAQWTAAEVRRFIARITQQGQNKCILVADEMDGIVQADKENDYNFLHGLRSATEAQMLKVILAGGRALRQSAEDHKSPLYNFGRKVPVDRFTREEVRALVEDPLRQLDVEIEDIFHILGELMKHSGGHPQVVQYVLLSSIEKLESGKRRMLRPIDIDETVRDGNTLGYYRHAAESGADPLQLMILWVLTLRLIGSSSAHFPTGKSMTSDEILAEMQPHIGRTPGMHNVLSRLRALEDLGIISEPHEGHWGFASPLYALALTNDRDLKSELHNMGRRMMEESRGRHV